MCRCTVVVVWTTESATGGKQQCQTPRRLLWAITVRWSEVDPLFLFQGSRQFVQRGRKGKWQWCIDRSHLFFFFFFLILACPPSPSPSLLYFPSPCLLQFLTEPIFTPSPTGHIQIQSCNWVSPSRPQCLALTPALSVAKAICCSPPLFLCVLEWKRVCPFVFSVRA